MVRFDFPDIINEIVDSLKYDVHTLYDLSLVNRSWCTLVIPRLWANPFSYTSNAGGRSAEALVKVYLSCLPSYQKRSISKLIDIPERKVSIFNYPSYLKILPLDSITDTLSYVKNPGSDMKRIYVALLKLILQTSFGLKEARLFEEIPAEVIRYTDLPNSIRSISISTRIPSAKALVFISRQVHLEELLITSTTITKIECMTDDILKHKNTLKTLSICLAILPTENYHIIFSIASQMRRLEKLMIRAFFGITDWQMKQLSEGLKESMIYKSHTELSMTFIARGN
ncbi:6242_t:CDS:1 [Paraglomus brasilianum]|uniref:6242_t:CDS:1 n=1 Tax=Paraglomus brasilianum TaxID=144538 RepID=A0A9N9BTR5_9GLOM|nr:6242_t:CDS:1 [Paraglomus brasilianum]